MRDADGGGLGEEHSSLDHSVAATPRHRAGLQIHFVETAVAHHVPLRRVQSVSGDMRTNATAGGTTSTGHKQLYLQERHSSNGIAWMGRGGNCNARTNGCNRARKNLF